MVLTPASCVRGLTLANIAGSRPSRPIANRMRVWPYRVTRVTEKIEITAPAAKTVPPGAAMMFSRITARPASLSVGELCRGCAPTPGDGDQDVDGHHDSAPMIARGMVFCGSLTSSPAVETASRPMNEKKIVPAAAPMPATTDGAEAGEVVGVERREGDDDEHHQHAELDHHHDGVDRGRLARAADQQQRTSRPARRPEIDDAGGVVLVRSRAQYDRARAAAQPKRLSSSWLKYWLQPTATAAVETPYSSSRQAATPIATTSPEVGVGVRVGRP